MDRRGNLLLIRLIRPLNSPQTLLITSTGKVNKTEARKQSAKWIMLLFIIMGGYRFIGANLCLSTFFPFIRSLTINEIKHRSPKVLRWCARSLLCNFGINRRTRMEFEWEWNRWGGEDCFCPTINYVKMIIIDGRAQVLLISQQKTKQALFAVDRGAKRISWKLFLFANFRP